MIQPLFPGKLDYEKRRRAGALPSNLADVRRDGAGALAHAASGIDDVEHVRRQAGFTKPIATDQPASAFALTVAPGLESAGLWFERPSNAVQEAGARLLAAAACAADGHASVTSEADQRVIDYALVLDLGFPGYLGGPFALLRYLGAQRSALLLGG